MALYEYRCNGCGKVFEKIVRWPDSERQQVCPGCQSQDTQRKISTFAALGGSSSSGASASGGCGSSGRFH